MRKMIVCFFVFIATLGKAQTPTYDCEFYSPVSDLGIGVITTEERFILLYNDSLLKDEYVLWDYSNENKPVPSKPLCGIFNKPDYNNLHVVCLRVLKNCFEVLINHNQKKYMPHYNSFEFYTWDKYLLNRIFGLGRGYGLTGQHIYKAPSEISDTLAGFTRDVGFCPVSVKGDWVEVQLNCKEDQDEPCRDYITTCTNQRGWLRWRKGNMLLIDVSLFL